MVSADLLVDRARGLAQQAQQVEGRDFRNPKPNSVKTETTLTLTPRSKRIRTYKHRSGKGKPNPSKNEKHSREIQIKKKSTVSARKNPAWGSSTGHPRDSHRRRRAQPSRGARTPAIEPAGRHLLWPQRPSCCCGGPAVLLLVTAWAGEES